MSSLAHVAFDMDDTEIAEDVTPDIHFNLYLEKRDL
jgi:hypothetical protein